MFNKKERFFKKVLQSLPKLQQKELIKLYEELIQERSFFLELIEENPQSVIVFQDKKVIFQGLKIIELLQEIPELYFHQNYVGLISIIDLKQNERIINIDYLHNHEYKIFYVKDITESYKFMISKKIDDGLGALENLAAGIAHEIKNPLMAIDIHTQLLQRQIQKKKISVSIEIINYLKIVQTENARLLKVLNEFMDRTRKGNPKFVFTELAYIINNVINVFEGEFVDKKIMIETIITQVPKIFTAPVSLQQALSDLIRNAIEALENIGNKKILITLTEDQMKDHIIISIEDSGIGISEDIKTKLFTPYFTTKKTGTGLGLTFVKKIVNELNGEIQLMNSKIGGLACIIRLPMSYGQKQLTIIK